MFRKQSFWKGSALLLASAMTAKLLGACFKIPLTNVLGGTGRYILPFGQRCGIRLLHRILEPQQAPVGQCRL